MDGSVHFDGHRSLAGMALRWLRSQSTSAHIVYLAACVQCTLELAFLYLEPRLFGARRHHNAVDPYRRYSILFLAREPTCWCAAHPLPVVGQFRLCTKLLPLATEPTGSWLVTLLPDKSLTPTAQTTHRQVNLNVRPRRSNEKEYTRHSWPPRHK